MTKKQVTIYRPVTPGSYPLVYLNLFNEEEAADFEAAAKDMGLLDRCLVATVSGLDWNRELSPWPAERVFKQDADFAGEAEGYLTELLEEIRPGVLAELAGEGEAEDSRAAGGYQVAYEAIAGYSMAGLFATWAVTKTDVFARLMSASGSLWFEGFTEYLGSWAEEMKGTEKPMGHIPERAYFSLGSKEKKVRNPLTSLVEERTLEAEAVFSGLGSETIFESNPGNHFVDIGGRMARGIEWMLGLR